MSPPRSWPGKLAIPKLAGKIIVDTYRGQQRMRSWPRKRGSDLPHNVKTQNARFTEANRLAKRADGLLQAQAIDAVKHSGLYPRDLLVKEILRGVVTITTEEGRTLEQHRPYVEDIEMQGFGLRLDANQGNPTGGTYHPTWPLPEFDTADFWNVATPDRITIPPFVTHMLFFGGMQYTTSVSGNQLLVLERLAPSSRVVAIASTGSLDLMTLASGVVEVAEGEEWAFGVNTNIGATLLAERTFFNGLIVGAV